MPGRVLDSSSSIVVLELFLVELRVEEVYGVSFLPDLDPPFIGCLVKSNSTVRDSPSVGIADTSVTRDEKAAPDMRFDVSKTGVFRMGVLDIVDLC